jgi:hypothetical protein
MAEPPVVAVINTNPDLVELLKVRIEAAGFVVLAIYVADRTRRCTKCWTTAPISTRSSRR